MGRRVRGPYVRQFRPAPGPFRDYSDVRSSGELHPEHSTMTRSSSGPVQSSRVSWEPQGQASASIFISAFIAVARAIESMGSSYRAGRPR